MMHLLLGFETSKDSFLCTIKRFQFRICLSQLMLFPFLTYFVLFEVELDVMAEIGPKK